MEGMGTTTTVDREGRSGHHQQRERKRETGFRKPLPQKERGEEPPPPPHKRRRGEEPSQHKRGREEKEPPPPTKKKPVILPLSWWIASQPLHGRYFLSVCFVVVSYLTLSSCRCSFFLRWFCSPISSCGCPSRSSFFEVVPSPPFFFCLLSPSLAFL